MRREIAVIEAADADEGECRTVMEGDGRVAACGRAAGNDIGRGVRRWVEGNAVAARLIEGRDRVLAACCHAIVPEGLVAAGKADQCRAAARGALDRVVRAAPHGC